MCIRDRWCVATVYDLLLAQYGVDRGFGGGNVATSFDDNVPGTPCLLYTSRCV